MTKLLVNLQVVVCCFLLLSTGCLVQYLRSTQDIDFGIAKGNLVVGEVSLPTDTYTTQAERVAFMTMHAAKGLEFPVVFVAGCESGLIPFKRSDKDSTDIDEERRLFFVAMTRAKERLFLTCAKKRKIYGKTEKRTLSPFVEEIEERLRSHEEHAFKQKRKDGHKQMKLF